MTPARVTLLTDFGTRDGFVGAVKGVLASQAPGVVVDDIAHDLPPGDVVGGALALARYWRRYPEGTVHIVVVDPGVGTGRAALACAAAGRLLVGPDNGVLTAALAEPGARCARIDARRFEGAAPTFHGRDLFAPAAAALARGAPLASLGPAFDMPVLLESPAATREPPGGRGEVVAIDRFGNLTTNLPGAWADAGAAVELGGVKIPVRRTYGDVRAGEPVAVVDSEGRIEIAVRDGSAAESMGAAPGDPVTLHAAG